MCWKVFPYSFDFLFVLADNGSEFKEHSSNKLKELHLTYYHTCPRIPRMNTHVERFNRTIQEELVDYLIFYNVERVHHTFENKLSPVQL